MWSPFFTGHLYVPHRHRRVRDQSRQGDVIFFPWREICHKHMNVAIGDSSEDVTRLPVEVCVRRAEQEQNLEQTRQATFEPQIQKAATALGS